jgi:hypothetical protein
MEALLSQFCVTVLVPSDSRVSRAIVSRIGSGTLLTVRTGSGGIRRT